MIHPLMAVAMSQSVPWSHLHALILATTTLHDCRHSMEERRWWPQTPAVCPIRPAWAVPWWRHARCPWRNVMTWLYIVHWLCAARQLSSVSHAV